MGFNGGFMGFYGGFMGLYGFLMVFFLWDLEIIWSDGDLMGFCVEIFMGDLMESGQMGIFHGISSRNLMWHVGFLWVCTRPGKRLQLAMEAMAQSK